MTCSPTSSLGARLVVAAAIQRVQAGAPMVLAAQRAHPEPEAGRWEFPGGSVEPGEAPEQALARECREELRAAVIPLARLGPSPVLRPGLTLRLYACLCVGEEPVAVVHRRLCWVGVDQLAELDWLPADLILLPAVRRWLG